MSEQRVYDNLLPPVLPGDPEPPVGTWLAVGARPGEGDGLQFVRLSDAAGNGWMAMLNGHEIGRVAWGYVEFWAPLRRAA